MQDTSHLCFLSTWGFQLNDKPGGRLSTVDILIKVACFASHEDIFFNLKMILSMIKEVNST